MQKISSNMFVPPHSLKTAVLFLIFNRPDTTTQVFEAIQKAKPPRFYVAADGPRIDKPGEKEKVEQVRRIVTQVDWDCEVKTLFRDKNLGCRVAISGAIDWFFENEEEGIILEDDCLPNQSFFWFCEELLERYRDDERVMHIGGHPHLIENKKTDCSYFFSKYSHIWGWASWRRAWKYYDVNLCLWPKTKSLGLHYDMFNTKEEARYREILWDRVWSGRIDTWDYQWIFAVRLQSGLAILPKKNLIKNIGFGPEATHTRQTKATKHDEPYFEAEFPMHHPEFVLVDSIFDSAYFQKGIYFTEVLKNIVITTSCLSNLVNRFSKLKDKNAFYSIVKK